MRTKWRLVKYNDVEYAKYGSMLFRCCVKGLELPSWIWIKDISRYVNNQCVERR